MQFHFNIYVSDLFTHHNTQYTCTQKAKPVAAILMVMPTPRYQSTT